MAVNDKYNRTREGRFKWAELMAGGMNELEAYRLAFPLDSNSVWHIKNFKAKGIYPFGDIDDPQDNTVSSSVAQPVLELSDIPTVATSSDPVAQPSVVDVNDSVLMGKIKKLVDEAVRAQIEVIKCSVDGSASVVKIRPKLKRTMKNSTPTSFRFPTELLKRARAKAKTDPRGSMGLNGLVEALIFEYIGSPKDLLE